MNSLLYARPHRHARSSSLDLNKLKLNAPVPPEVPPRVSPQMTAQISLDAQLDVVNSQFADFAHFPESVVEVIKFISNVMQNILLWSGEEIVVYL